MVEKQSELDENQIKFLHQFRKGVRNNYAHYNLNHISENYIFSNIRVRDEATKKESIVNFRANTHPFYQVYAKNNIDKKTALKNFKEIVDIVIKLLEATDDIYSK